MPIIAAAPGLILLLALIYFCWNRWALGTCWNLVFWPALFFKLSCGILLGLFYAENFDTHRYQAASQMMTTVGRQDLAAYLQILFFDADNYLPVEFLDFKFRSYSNSFFFVKLLSLLNFLTGSQYFLNSLLLSSFSFAGFWYFARTMGRYFNATSQAAIISFLFFPSIVFWTSGVLKETVLAGLLGFFWAVALRIQNQPVLEKWRYWLVLGVCGYGLWKIKFFVAALIFGLTGVWLGLSWLRKTFPVFRRPIVLISGLVILTALLALAIARLHENFNLQFLLDHLVQNYRFLEQRSLGKPYIAFSSFEPSLDSVLRNLPEAILAVFYRPFIWEGEGMLYRLAGLENLLLLLISLGVLIDIPQILRGRVNGFYVMLLVFGLVLAGTFALATPNLGSLNRYRVAFLPFLLYLALQAPVWQRLLNRFRPVFPKLDTGG